jgi:hypothetical protein
MTSKDHDISSWNPQFFGEEFDQGLIGLAVNRRGSNGELQGSTMQATAARLGCPGLDMDPQQRTAVFLAADRVHCS